MKKLFLELKGNHGVTAVEYGLIAALISIVIISVVTITGVNTKNVFCVVATELEKTLSLSNNGDCSGSSSTSSGNSSNTSSISFPEKGDQSNKVGMIGSMFVWQSLQPKNGGTIDDLSISGLYDGYGNPLTTLTEVNDYYEGGEVEFITGTPIGMSNATNPAFTAVVTGESAEAEYGVPSGTTLNFYSGSNGLTSSPAP